jgi:Ca-activated chloride channel family protein
VVTFLHPYLFWALLIPFVVFAILVATNKEKIERIFDERVLERLSAASESMPLRVRHIIIFSAVFLFIVAIARPVIDNGEQKVEVRGLSVLTALDISGSMRSRDVYPNRLGFAKMKLKGFLDAMPSDEVAVAAFAYNAFMIAPFTSDKATLKMLIDGVDDSYISNSATDFRALGDFAAELLENKSPKILVLFTDGGDEEAIKGFGDVLKSNGIDLYAVLVGTKKGAPVLDSEGKPLKDKNGDMIITRRNDDLGLLAKRLGGAYVIAANGNGDMLKLAETIHAKYPAQKQGEVSVRDTTELFYYPLALGLLLLLIGLSSAPRRSVKKERV